MQQRSALLCAAVRGRAAALRQQHQQQQQQQQQGLLSASRWLADKAGGDEAGSGGERSKATWMQSIREAMAEKWVVCVCVWLST